VLFSPWKIFKYLFIEELFRIKEFSVIENNWDYKVEYITLYTPEVYRRVFSFATRIDKLGDREDRDMMEYHGVKDSNYAFATKEEAERSINLYKGKNTKVKAIYHEVAIMTFIILLSHYWKPFGEFLLIEMNIISIKNSSLRLFMKELNFII
jgi:hypothetical protein